jgi:hypothetical protein
MDTNKSRGPELVAETEGETPCAPTGRQGTLNAWGCMLSWKPMRRAGTAAWGLALGFTLVAAGSAAVPSATQIEIEHLLTAVGSSGCEFHRNGSWYDATRAQAHLRQKLELLAANDQIRTAEDFIEKVATKSAVTQLPYEVRCGGGAAVSLNGWLRDELNRYRQQATAVGRSASRETRDALRHPRYPRLSVLMSNLDVTTDVLDAFGLARNGDRPVGCFLRACRPAEPHDAVLIGVHVNTSETLDVLGGEL